MSEQPTNSQFPDTELVCENGSWFIRALGPVEPLTVEMVREMIEAARSECCS